MNSKKKKIFKKLISLISVFFTIPITSCATSSDQIKGEFSNWDEEITLTYRWENSDSWDKQAFLKLLTDNFNKLKNSNDDFKSLPDTKFNLNIISDTNKLLQDLKSDKPDVDLAILPYYSFADENLDNNFPIFVAQTGTLKFKWTPPDATFYVDGSINDPLRKAAELENKIQFGEPYGEFRNWKDTKDIYGWDGSKYKSFYQDDSYTYVYRGSILISGTTQEQESIKKAWDEKDWNSFARNGIIFKNFNTGGGFKYQVSILAKHFSNYFGSNNSIYDYFINKSNSDNFLTGKSADSIGQLQGNNKTFNIAFDDEGAFNWTPKQWGSHLYNPTNKSSVVRVLTLTNPAPYDAVLGRVGLNKKQANLIGQALSSIKGNENVFGIFTGYNYFKNGSDISFNDLIKLQKNATNLTMDKADITIPRIEN